jgi:GNAT superfamily N-acetyltransferase
MTTGNDAALIRRAGPGDADQVAALLLAAFREFEPLYTPAGYQATTPSAPEIAARLAEGPTWIVLDGAVVVGTVSALDRGDEVYIRSMAVHPARRGHGLASQLLTVVHAYAISRGARRLTLTTTPFLTDAIRLYERTGFQRSPGPGLDLHGTPLFAMTKELALVGTGCLPQS